MFFLLGFLCLVISAGLILAVVVQNSKGGGLSSAIVGGGATQLLGSRRSSELIEKITWYMAAALAIFAFVANIVIAAPVDEETRLRLQGPIENTVVAPSFTPNPNAESAVQEAIQNTEETSPTPGE